MNIRFLSIFFLSMIMFSKVSWGDISDNDYTTITFDQLKPILEENQEKAFRVERARYGKLGTQQVSNVTQKLQTIADFGTFFIPQNMNAAFGDPSPGIVKELRIFFKMNQKMYRITIHENWFTESTTPDWYKNQNEYILLSNLKNITLDELKPILEENQEKAFTIERARYGKFTTKQVSNVIEKLQAKADLGKFFIPQNMNAAFGDPAPGLIKNLRIVFTMNQKMYRIIINEYWFANLNAQSWYKNPNQYITLQ